MGPIGYPETSVKITTSGCVMTQQKAVLFLASQMLFKYGTLSSIIKTDG